jgi:hypothetical protein
MESISTRADELIIQADLELLYSILDEFVEIGKLFEDSKDMAVLILKLNRFCDIHKVRCHDLIGIKKKVDEARDAYQSLKLKYDGQKELADHYKKIYEEFLQKNI